MAESIIFQPGDTFTIGNGDLTLTAVWIPVYKVIYNANASLLSGNPPSDPVEYPSGAVATVKGSGDLNNAGTPFYCWNTKPDGSGTGYFPGSTLIIENSDITLYAQYRPTLISVVYEVIYNANGATSGYVPDSVRQYDPVTISGNTGGLIKEGYSFAGWNTADDGTGTTYMPGDVYDSYGTLKLYAKWDPIYSVSYKNGADEIDLADPQKYAKGSKVKLLDYNQAADWMADGSQVFEQPSGKEFMGWNTMSDGSGETYMPGDVVTLDSDLVLYPMWETCPPMHYIVTFDGDGNTDGLLPSRRIVTNGEMITIPISVNLKKEGYIFGGWSTENCYDDSSKKTYHYFAGDNLQIIRHTTFYARWIKICRVTYDTRGYGNAPVDNNDYLPGTTVTVQQYSRDSFIGWSQSPDGTVELYKLNSSFIDKSSFTIEHDTTLYAVFPSSDMAYYDPPRDLISTRELSYNSNGADSGHVPQAPTTYNAGTIIEVKGNTGYLEKAGYFFNGWNTKPDGKGISYAEGDTLTVPDNNVVLFAKWSVEPPFKVSIRAGVFDKDGNNITDYNIVYQGLRTEYYLKGDTVEIRDNLGLCEEGKTFSGWKDLNKGGTYKPGQKITIYRAYHMVAVWESKITYYSLNYDPGSNPGITNLPSDSNPYVSGDEATISTSEPSCSGMFFIMWNTKPDGSGRYYAPGGKIRFGLANITLYPIFTSSTVVKLTYDGNGSTGGEPHLREIHVWGNTITVRNQNTLTKPGYYFDGWCTNADGNGTIYQTGDTISVGSEDINLYAIWRELPSDGTNKPDCRIVYKSFGHTDGAAPVDDKPYMLGETATVSGYEELRKEGHYPGGWMIDNRI